MSARRITRRALIGGAGVLAVAGVVLTRFVRSGGVFEDTFELADGTEGWGSRWVAPHWNRLTAEGGAGVLRLPAGLGTTAPDQPIPVFLQDHDLRTGTLEMRFSTEGNVRPGILFAARDPFAFAATTLEGERLLLARYEREKRTVIAEAPARGVDPSTNLRMTVEIEANRLRVEISSGDEERVLARLSSKMRAELGSVGVIAVHPPDLGATDLRIDSFTATANGAGFRATKPVCTVSTTGPLQTTGATVSVWSAYPAEVTFQTSGSAVMAEPRAIERIEATSPPYVARASLELPESGRIFWRARLRSTTSDDETTSPVHGVHAPASDRPLILAAASCMHLTGPPENRGFVRLLQAAGTAPDLLVFQGDIGYPNNTRNSAYFADADFFADRFHRVLARPDLELLRLNTPAGFTLDDHDYGPPNNANRTTVEPWAIDLWNRIHANPTDVGYWDTRLGDVHCLTLDVRRYADPANAAKRLPTSRLGAEQFGWMEDLLRTSDASAFVIFSAGTFAARENPRSGELVDDCFFYGWRHEFERAMTLFGDIQEQGKRVLIVAGDAHSLRVHHHQDPLGRGKPIVEFICAGLRTDLSSGAASGDTTLDPERNVLDHPGSGLVTIDPPDRPNRSITVRAIAASADDPLDLFPSLQLPFAP